VATPTSIDGESNVGLSFDNSGVDLIAQTNINDITGVDIWLQGSTYTNLNELLLNMVDETMRNRDSLLTLSRDLADTRSVVSEQSNIIHTLNDTTRRQQLEIDALNDVVAGNNEHLRMIQEVFSNMNTDDDNEEVS
jgi:uncharacterized coiled-coil protein SlyX